MAPGMLKFEPPHALSKTLHGLLIIASIVIPWLGIAAIFYHFGVLLGATFLVVSLGTYLLFLWIRCDISKGKLLVRDNQKLD